MSITANILFEVISRQDFADFYNEGGDFDNFIQGQLDAKDKGEIIEQLNKFIKKSKGYLQRKGLSFANPKNQELYERFIEVTKQFIIHEVPLI